MESIAANSGLTPLARPTIALQGDLPAMMKEGRVLSGEVMQSLDGGSLLLSIGEHKVAADAQVELEPGQKFRAQVIRKNGELALQLLPSESRVLEPALLRALRSLIGAELPVADLLGELSAGLAKEGTVHLRMQVLLEQLAGELKSGLVRHANTAGLPVPSAEALAAFSADLALGLEQAASTIGRLSSTGPLTPEAFAELAQRFGRQLVTALESRPQGPVRDFVMQGVLRAGAEPLFSKREGTLLAVLQQAGSLAAEGSAALPARPQDAQALLALLQRAVYQPGSGGEELKQAIEPGAFGYENAVLAAASDRGVDTVEAALKNLANEIRARLASGPADPPAPVKRELAARLLGDAIERAVKSLLQRSMEGPLTRKGFEALVRAFEREFARALRAQSRTPEHESTLRTIESLPKGELVRGREGALVRALLAAGGKLGPGVAQAAVDGMAGDTRGLLLDALLGGGLGSARESVSRALGGLELQQIMNLARQESGEALHFSFPVQDVGGWTTAHLFLDPHGGRGEGGAEHDGENAVYRLVIGVDFSALGPIRADLLLAPGALSVRLMVSDPNLAQRIRRDVTELSEHLALGGRRVQIAVGRGTDRELDVGALAHDIRFLRENHLMDMKG